MASHNKETTNYVLCNAYDLIMWRHLKIVRLVQNTYGGNNNILGVQASL